MEKNDAVCVVCRRLRIDGEWSNKIAEESYYKILGRIICPYCGPNPKGGHCHP